MAKPAISPPHPNFFSELTPADVSRTPLHGTKYLERMGDISRDV